jgi:hypothetical protein
VPREAHPADTEQLLIRRIKAASAIVAKQRVVAGRHDALWVAVTHVIKTAISDVDRRDPTAALSWSSVSAGSGRSIKAVFLSAVRDVRRRRISGVLRSSGRCDSRRVTRG